MARPLKQGIDYFPLDVHTDDKFKFIEIKFKLEGFGVIIKLLQRIYSCGYWYEWGEDEALIFAHENNIDLDLLGDVLQEALKRDIFSNDLFDKYQILTSTGIQKRYQEIVKRRKGVEIIPEYLLIEGDFGVNVDINHSKCKHNASMMEASSKHDVSRSTQSKVKESKSKNTKVSNSKTSKTEKYDLSSFSEKYELEKPFAKVVIDWLQYKKDRRETYKSDRSIKAFITELKNLSNSDPIVAKKITEQSFANNYAGIFELKANNKAKKVKDVNDKWRQDVNQIW